MHMSSRGRKVQALLTRVLCKRLPSPVRALSVQSTDVSASRRPFQVLGAVSRWTYAGRSGRPTVYGAVVYLVSGFPGADGSRSPISRGAADELSIAVIKLLTKAV